LHGPFWQWASPEFAPPPSKGTHAEINLIPTGYRWKVQLRSACSCPLTLPCIEDRTLVRSR
jgi:hypothetical protein